LPAFIPSRNDASKAIGALMKAGKGDEAEASKQAVREIGDRLKDLDAALLTLDERTAELMLGLPNIVSDDVPDGPDDSGNVVIWEEGERRSYDFDLKPHWELSESLGITDFERGAKVSGRMFYVLGEPRGCNERWSTTCSTYTATSTATASGACRFWCCASR
jgi:seryl-tRNA synthetase